MVGLPWGPHNESFDWVVRLEQRSFWSALFDKFPSVLSLRPLGTGPAWALYRLAGHDVAGVELANAALAMPNRNTQEKLRTMLFIICQGKIEMSYSQQSRNVRF